MADFIFKIGEREFLLQDLGPTMNAWFMALHESHFSHRAVDITQFRKAASEFFSQNIGQTGAHDRFFNNFTVLWREFVTQGRFKHAAHLWKFALDIASEWEKKNPQQRIHKGTPYYFWAGACILEGDLEKGFLLMHRALGEDKETHQKDSPKTPAWFFVTLDHTQQEQFFRPQVQAAAEFLAERLKKYRGSRGGNLSLEEFRARFLEEPDLQEIAFSFVFEAFHLKILIGEIDQALAQNVFGSLLHSSVIFNLCLVMDNIIKHKNPDPNPKGLADHLNFLSSQASLNLDAQKLKELNGAFRNNFGRTLQELLQSNYHFRDGSSPKAIEEDLGIAYGFRNLRAHKIEDQPIVSQNFEEILQRVLNALFFSVEQLYR